MKPQTVPPAWIDAAGALFLAATRHADTHPTGLDAVTSRFLQGHRHLGDEGRGFVVRVAQDMMRARRRIEAAAKLLGYDPTRAGMVCLWLVGEREADPHTLPIDPRGAVELRQAWRSTDALPLHIKTNVPAWLIEELSVYREDADALCHALSDTPPMTLRANTLRGNQESVLAALAREGLHGAPGALAPEAIVLDTRRNVFRSSAFREGLFEVQDEGSQLVSLMCSAQPGMVVVDGCAGAGGKTLHLAAMMEGKGTIYAFDVSTHRLDALRDRARRAGAHNIRVHALDDTRPRKRLAETADVVLVDAPCSGSGVLRRNPDTAWRLTPSDVDRMQSQQLQILSEYAPLVRPGGRLVYATCSILRRENQGIVDAFLESHRDFHIVPAHEILQGYSALKEALCISPGALSLDPLRHGTDGFFACALTRSSR